MQMTLTDLEVPELGERVNNDAKDDVETDGCDEDKEWSVVDDEKAELCKRVFRRVTHQTLQPHVITHTRILLKY